jgi:excinuclease UvrABC nuclease subunit
MTTQEYFDECLYINPLNEAPEKLGALPNCKGVVLFADEADRPIQLLITCNIRRLSTCRLFAGGEEGPTKHTNIAEITRRIYYRCCYNHFACSFEHWQIARALWPKTYRQLSLFTKQSYVKIDQSPKWPRFVLADKPLVSETTKIFGPFPNRKSVNSFIEILQDSFGLCRRGKMVESEARAISCPYLQMGQCSGPCAGKVSRAEYIEQIEQAISTASGNTQQQKARLENRMRRLCERMEFEQAEMVRKQLGKLELLNKEMYCWTGDLAQLAILHIDKSAKVTEPGKRKKTQSFSAFLIRYGSITRSADFTLDGIEDFHKTFVSNLAQDTPDAEAELLYDRLGLLSYFLYRSRRPGIWIDCSAIKIKPTAEQIKEMICEHFGLEKRLGQNSNNEVS